MHVRTRANLSGRQGRGIHSLEKKGRAIRFSSAYLGIVSHCEVQRRIAVRILVVDLRAAVETELDELFVAVLRGDEQEGVALLVGLVDRKVCVERVLHALRLAVPSLHKDGRHVGHSALARPPLPVPLHGLRRRDEDDGCEVQVRHVIDARQTVLVFSRHPDASQRLREFARQRVQDVRVVKDRV